MVKKIIIFLLIVIALVVITMLNKSNNKKVKKANNRKTNTIKNEKKTPVKDVALVEERTSSKKKEVEIDPEGLKARAVRGSEETKSIKRGRARRK